MFSRRRGSAKAKPRTPLDNSTSTAATTAGQLAFLQQSGSTSAPLSSAAAAAALRSHTTTPEPVGSLQTKRLIRKTSTSSLGSTGGAGINGRPGLVRTGSNGSMTERTFRSPSPARWNASSPRSDVPPVPALPHTHHRPSSSLGAPQRITSPTPGQGKRSSSVDEVALAAQGTSRPGKRLSNVAEREELERAHNDFVKNFSRRDISPPASPTEFSRQNELSAAGASKSYTHGMGSWYTQSNGTVLPTRPRAAESRTSSMSSLTLPPNQPLRGTQPVSAAGWNYGQQRTYGTAPSRNTTPQPKVYDPNSRTFVSKPVSQPSSQPALQAARRAKSMETVYDPNSRTFVPKYPPTYRIESGGSSPQSIASEPPRSMMPKKQRSLPAVSMTPEPPPRNPARFSSFTIVPSPTSPRTAPTLHKQPSVVREDTDAETRAEGVSSLRKEQVNGTRAAQPTVLPPKTYTAAPEPKQRSASLDVPRVGTDVSDRGRHVSSSPQRSAHFSPSPILQAEKHAPPPRDVSPAKSAMKQSPSMRPISPLAGVASPPSETSETPSLSALDGISGKKKKPARVSFDEQPRELGSAMTTIAPTMRDRSPAVEDDTDDDGMMKPRPALPSFGSVRRDRVQHSPAEKVTEMPPERHEVSSDHAVGGILRSSLDPLPPEVTSKESAGYISDESSDPDIPVPSAGAVESAKMEDQKVPSTEAREPTIVDFAHTNGPDVSNQGDVPTFALMPPTPLLSDDSKRDLSETSETRDINEARARNSMDGITIPGGWDDEIDKPTATPPSSTAPPPAEAAKPTPEPSMLPRSSSAEDSAATTTVTPITLTSSPLPLSDIDEDTTDSAEFSDAFEDPSDFEDEGGFASLDAIVESPIPSPMEIRTIPFDREIPESPSVKQVGKTPEIFDGSEAAADPAVRETDIPDVADQPASPTSGATWQEATAYWSQLSREKRAQIEREALSSDDEARSPPVVAPKKTKTKKTSREAATGTSDQQAQPTLRKTMRARSGPVAAKLAGDDRVHMRSSMRSGGTMASSLRDTSPTQKPQPAYIETRSAVQTTTTRPVSAGGPPVSLVGATKAVRPVRPQSPISRKSDDSIYSQDAPSKKTPSVRPKAEPPKVSARLQKELAKADDSDSESSFKKRRKGASNLDAQGRYNIRKSMRTGSVERVSISEPVESRPESPTSERGGRFSFRSMSPTFGRNKTASARDSSQESGMRTSLRGKQAPQAGGMKTSMRGSSSYQAPSKPTTANTKSKIKSRFADSDDDEDAPRRTVFKSRFADSDDESDTGSPRFGRADLTPVRGIPRRKGQEDGDSTDLEEEADDNPAERASKRFTGLIGPHPASAETDKSHDVKEGEALQKGSLRQRPVDETPQKSVKPADVNFSPPDKKKRGFMSSILRRNRQSSSSIPQVTSGSLTELPASPVVSAATPQTPRQERPSSPPLTSTVPSMPPTPGSPYIPARPPTGKLIRKESYQMWLQRTGSDFQNAPASPGPNSSLMKLQERDLNEYVRPPSPPIPESPLANAGARPTTSDGFSPEGIKLAQTMRPNLSERSQTGPLPRRVQIQAGEEGSEPGEREPKTIYSQKTGKKKKFGMLRKAFGLND